MCYNGRMKTKTLIAVAALLAAGTVFGAIRAVTPTAWNGKPDCWQQKRHAEKMVEVAKGGAKVVFIGDSITHFWESKGKAQQKKYFSEGDWKMLDLGTSGDRTEHVLWRLDHGELDGYEAKCVLLMIGTNNSGHFKKFADETPMDTILGIRDILKKIRAKQPKAKVVLTAIFPRGASENDPFRLRNDAVNREIRRYCDGKDVFWCDFTDRFLDEKGDTKWVMPDRLHPVAQGYEIWYEEVKPYIEYALSDGKKPLPKNRFSKVKTAFEKATASLPATVAPATRIAMKHRRGDWWSERLLQKRNQIVASKGEFDLVFFGDSITHGWEGGGKAKFAELSKTYSILNIGYSDRREAAAGEGPAPPDLHARRGTGQQTALQQRGGQRHHQGLCRRRQGDLGRLQRQVARQERRHEVDHAGSPPSERCRVQDLDGRRPPVFQDDLREISGIDKCVNAL